ncbi:hypothetical protein HNP47_002583 [Brevundimonas vesicularis]|jgi:hypothetical protein|uniref:Uncharacterized protein n=1 Tax=Brevundimonas vesicularis TaxID=41276 RepID=A0A7W9FVW8_BREVE|nr:hypothetical protein [Brevundimonas vesicularis]
MRARTKTTSPTHVAIQLTVARAGSVRVVLDDRPP